MEEKTVIIKNSKSKKLFTGEGSTVGYLRLELRLLHREHCDL